MMSVENLPINLHGSESIHFGVRSSSVSILDWPKLHNIICMRCISLEIYIEVLVIPLIVLIVKGRQKY